jgi:chromosome segregation ATPase
MKRHAQRAAHRFLQVLCAYSPFASSLLTSIISVLANLSNVPKQYHAFISPPLRRVYLADAEDNSRAIIDHLKSEIAALTERIVTLDAIGKYWFERGREARNAASRLASAERDARLDLDGVKEETRVAMQEARVALQEAHIAVHKTNQEACVALNKAAEDMLLLNQRLNELKSENDALKSQWVTRAFSC